NDQLFSFVEDEILWTRNIKTQEKVKVISLQELNAIMKAESDSRYRRFPEHSWTIDKKLLLTAGGSSFLFNPESKQTEWQIALPSEAENAITEEKGQFVAYTIDQDLYISFKNNQHVRITNDGGNGIVNGQ